MNLRQLTADILLAAGVLLLAAGVIIAAAGEGKRNEQPGEVIAVRAENFSLDYENPRCEVTLEIPEGTSTLETAGRLEEKGLAEAEEFLALIAYLDLERNIRSGTYSFSSEDGLSEVIQRITVRR